MSFLRYTTALLVRALSGSTDQIYTNRSFPLFHMYLEENYRKRSNSETLYLVKTFGSLNSACSINTEVPAPSTTRRSNKGTKQIKDPLAAASKSYASKQHCYSTPPPPPSN